MARSGTVCESGIHPSVSVGGSARAFVRRPSSCAGASVRLLGLAAGFDGSLFPQSPTPPTLALPQLGGGNSCWCCRTMNSLPRAGGGLGWGRSTLAARLLAHHHFLSSI